MPERICGGGDGGVLHMPRWSRRRREDEGASSLSPLLPLRMRGSVAYDRVELSPLPSLDTSRLVGVVVETVRESDGE